MRAIATYDYALVRVVPRVDRGEFMNVGAIVSSPTHDYLAARIEVDPARMTALDPTLDLAALESHLAAIPRICAGGPAAGALGMLSARERFRWLTAPRSSIVQCSPAHTGRCDDPARLLEHLVATMVRTPRPDCAG